MHLWKECNEDGHDQNAPWPKRASTLPSHAVQLGCVVRMKLAFGKARSSLPTHERDNHTPGAHALALSRHQLIWFSKHVDG